MSAASFSAIAESIRRSTVTPVCCSGFIGGRRGPRSVVACALLLAATPSCAPDTRSPASVSTPVTRDPAAVDGGSHEGGTAKPARSDGGAMPKPSPHAPTFDEEMACRRRHCYPAAARRCFDTCYKYNHLRDPAAHTTCDDGCRRSWDIDACERACALDRRAYSTSPGNTSAACASKLHTCRASCGSERRNSCEIGCLATLATCDGATP